MENHKRRLLTYEEDRISNLPNHLIGSILERLPIQDAVRTSTLSKKWRYKWTTMTALVLDEKFSKKVAKDGAFGRNGFIRIVNQLLILHSRPISKFSLYIPRVYLDSFQEVDQWMLFLSRNNVKELILINSNWHYQLPSHVFSCSGLRKLKLEKCIFKSPIGFGGFPNLQDLCLKNIIFGGNFCGTKVNLPQLRKLTLNACAHVYKLNINAVNLQSLSVITCPDAMLSQLVNSPCLTVVGITLRESTPSFLRVERMDLTRLLTILPNVQQLFVDGHFIKFLSADKIPNWPSHPVHSLKRLWFVDFQLCDLDQLHSALCLLHSSPNVERLSIMNLQRESHVIRNDVEPASNHLESPNCLGLTLNQLKIVDMTRLEGSRPELLFIKLLLAHSPSLSKLTIVPTETSDASQRFNIAKDIMRFPRASPRAEIIYLDPK